MFCGTISIVEIRHGPITLIAKNKSTTFLFVICEISSLWYRVRLYEHTLCFLFCQKCIGGLLQVLFVFLDTFDNFICYDCFVKPCKRIGWKRAYISHWACGYDLCVVKSFRCDFLKKHAVCYKWSCRSIQ